MSGWSRTARWMAAAAGVAAGGYATYAGVTWLRYGHPARPRPGEEDALLDDFISEYDVVERHRILVNAPAAMTLAAAQRVDFTDLPLAQAMFKGREFLLGATHVEQKSGANLLESMQSMGWVVLAEIPGREVVLGAVTRPWQANVVFRSIPPGEFRSFREPDYVKIAWTLRADEAGDGQSVFRTETRAVATDAEARAKFRRYWSFLSPGIFLIRMAMLRPVRAEAQRLAARPRAEIPLE